MKKPNFTEKKRKKCLLTLFLTFALLIGLVFLFYAPFYCSLLLVSIVLLFIFTLKKKSVEQYEFEKIKERFTNDENINP